MNDVDLHYAATLEKLQSLGRFGVRLGLERVTAALERMGRPQERFASVHVAGTNGKGSTAAMLESCLRAAGLRTGLYTSPHLCRFTERLRVDGQEASRDDVVRLAGEVPTGQGLTFFEVVTAMALAHFAAQETELAVVEVGMGGRLDATNVVQPEVCVLTHIGLDHTEILGPDLASVTREKAGIIKPGVPVVSAPPPSPEAADIIQQRCEELKAPLYLLGRDFDLGGADGSLVFSMGRWRLDRLAPALGGQHQRHNAALCLAAASCLRRRGRAISDGDLRRGLAEVRWPGRLEWIDEDTLLDGAHNPAGSAALARALAASDRPFNLVLGTMGPGPGRPLVEPLLPHARRIVFTRPQSPRALDPAALASEFPGAEAAPDLASALALLRHEPGPRLITGSLYLVGEARALIAGEPVDPVLTADPR